MNDQTIEQEIQAKGLTAREVLSRRNTSPQFPANPGQPANPDVGVNAGIEGGQ